MLEPALEGHASDITKASTSDNKLIVSGSKDRLYKWESSKKLKKLFYEIEIILLHGFSNIQKSSLKFKLLIINLKKYLFCFLQESKLFSLYGH